MEAEGKRASQGAWQVTREMRRFRLRDGESFIIVILCVEGPFIGPSHFRDAVRRSMEGSVNGRTEGVPRANRKVTRFPEMQQNYLGGYPDVRKCKESKSSGKAAQISSQESRYFNHA